MVLLPSRWFIANTSVPKKLPIFFFQIADRVAGNIVALRREAPVPTTATTEQTLVPQPVASDEEDELESTSGYSSCAESGDDLTTVPPAIQELVRQSWYMLADIRIPNRRHSGYLPCKLIWLPTPHNHPGWQVRKHALQWHFGRSRSCPLS